MFLRVAHLCSGFAFCSKEVERAKEETAARKREEKRKGEGAQQVGSFEKSQYSVRPVSYTHLTLPTSDLV